jgi:tripartite-type tricarboxylate transporter receptor subunit TctC
MWISAKLARTPQKWRARMKLTTLLLSLVSAGLLASTAEAQTWPAKPLKVIVPAAAGSTVDIIPRIVFEQLATQLGQPIIIENRGGAGTTIGSAAVAKAEPDGYTLLVNSPAHTIAPALYPGLAYHPSRDFAAVIPLGISPSVLVVSPQKNFKAIADFVAAGKAAPNAMNFSSVGVGSATHLSAERFRASTGLQAVHVPYKGGAEAMTEVMAGRIDFFFGPVGLVLPLVKEGKLAALAVNGTARSAALPDVPTTAEAGVANAEYPFWIGMFVPAKTPPEIIDRLHRETLRALQEPKVRDRLVSLGVDPMPMTPREFESFVQKAIEVDAGLAKTSGLKATN